MKLAVYRRLIKSPPEIIATGKVVGFKGESGRVIQFVEDANVEYITPNLKIPGITVDQMACVWGVTLSAMKPFNPFNHRGRRARNRALRKEITEKIAKYNQILDLTGTMMIGNNSLYCRYLPLDTIIMFAKLTRRLPSKEEVKQIDRYPTFELWFALIYNDEQNPDKPLEESVFYSESEASKLYRSLLI